MVTSVAKRIEENLLPPPDELVWSQGHLERLSFSSPQKICYFALNLLKLVGNIGLLSVALPYSLVKTLALRAITLFQGNDCPSAVPPGPIDPAALPRHFGFADSLFQTSGLGTTASPTVTPGLSNWNPWLTPEHIEGTEDRNYKKFFFEVLSQAQPYVDLLKRGMNVTAHRISLEWSILQPTPGTYDPHAIDLYKNLFRLFKENGIPVEPYVTGCHFVCPEWFQKMGSFDKIENIYLYKNHLLRMMEIFPEITHWMPFNEINVEGFQSCVRGVYPPGRKGDLVGDAKRMRNMLIAHILIYKEAKERWPHLQIGSTHQWLNFEALEGNWLERIICYFLSKITHYACYNFYKTGRFSLQIPGQVNVQFTVPEAEFKRYNGFNDTTNVQFYGYPRLKAGFNGGHKYPGYKVINWVFGKFGLTFGSTCPRGGKMMSFGPSIYPESLEKCLQEATALGKKIVFSEIGVDATIQKDGEDHFKLDEETQRHYFEQIWPTLSKYREWLDGFFVWTLARGHLEWDRGNTPRLGVVDIMKDRERRIVGHRLSPAALLIQRVYGEKRDELLRSGALRSAA